MRKRIMKTLAMLGLSVCILVGGAVSGVAEEPARKECKENEHKWKTFVEYREDCVPTDFTLDKMKGLKVRVPETDLMINTMDALGASATAIAYSELYTSLQSGVVDAAENGVTSYMSNSFNEVAPYFITDAHTFGCGVILMNADKWNGFNDAEKGWIKEAALAARSACYEYNQKQEQACFDSFADKGITKLEVSDIEKWQEACAPLYEKESAEAQDIIAKIQGGNY